MFAPTPRTFITANIAASRQLRREFDAARKAEGALLWDSPDILPRDAWLRRSWNECVWREPAATPLLLTRSQELTLWEEAIQATTRDVLLNSRATAFAASEAWRLLHSWREDIYPGAAVWDETSFDSSDDTRAFFQWMRKVRQQLRERDWITMAEIPGELLSRVSPGAMESSHSITLYGFDEIAAVDRRLFNALGAVETRTRNEMGQRSRVACHDRADELTQAAAWARRKLEAESGVTANIGILVPDLASVASLAERIFDDVLHPAYGFQDGSRAFSLNAGKSLAEAPIVATALLALRLLNGMPREESAMLWRSPFLGIEPGEAARLDVELRRRKVEFSDLHVESVRRRFPEMAVAAVALPERLRPSQWSTAFSRLLRVSGWPGTRALTPVENQALEAWRDALSELARLDLVVGPISCSGAISRLETIAQGTRVALDDDNGRVWILDITDAAALRFDALWIAGLHAGAWPPRARPNPFLPVALQRAAGMPHCSAEREIVSAKRVMERLFSSASEVVCSHPAQAADEQQRPSPLIAGLPLSPELARPDTPMRRVFLNGPILELRPAEAPLPLPAGTLQRGGTSVLANQSACPFRAFAIHRLRAREMDEVDVGLSAMERGSVVHKALELLWRELQSQEQLRTLERDALESLIRSSADAALGHFVTRREGSPALDQFRALEQARLENLLRNWLMVENNRQNFVVIRKEDERTIEISGLTIKIRVDRVDRYDDGTHAIVDYKTSKKISTDMWEGDRPEAPQLPLYATKSDVPISDVAFGQITTESVEWKGLQGSDLRPQLPIWRDVVGKLAKDFMEGRTDVDPREKPDPCQFCSLSALCRVTEFKKIPARARNDE